MCSKFSAWFDMAVIKKYQSTERKFDSILISIQSISQRLENMEKKYNEFSAKNIELESKVNEKADACELNKLISRVAH